MNFITYFEPPYLLDYNYIVVPLPTDFFMSAYLNGEGVQEFLTLGFLRLFWEIFYLVSCVSWLVTSMFHHEVLVGNKGLFQLLFNLDAVGA